MQEFVKKEEADVWGSYEEQYGDVLDKYYAALSEKWDGQKLSSDGLSQLSLYCQEGNALENVGYAFLDVNGDGVCELMIGAIHGDEFVNKMLFELYTLEDGVPVQIFAGQERDRAAITEREAARPESVLREPQRVREAVREIARENLLQERLQQMERDMVRDLQKEKTLGGD